jgi:uncharacterized protein
MKRLLLAAAALFTLVALAGAVGLPDLAGAQDAAGDDADTITVTGVGSVETVPTEAQMSFGVETRRPTAKAAVAANGEDMRRVINALRRAGARELATEWVNVYPVSNGDDGGIDAYSASNSVSATIDADEAAALIDAASEAGANVVSGPGLSPSNTEELHREALADAVTEARLSAQALAKAAGRTLGEVTSISEVTPTTYEYAERLSSADAASTPILPGQHETTATITVTFSLS